MLENITPEMISEMLANSELTSQNICQITSAMLQMSGEIQLLRATQTELVNQIQSLQCALAMATEQLSKLAVVQEDILQNQENFHTYMGMIR